MKFTLEDIHAIVCTSIQHVASNDERCIEYSTDAFHDRIQSLAVTPRPLTKDAAIGYCTQSVLAADAANIDGSRWRILTLSLLKRRFHGKAPEARKVQKNKDTGTSSSTDAIGDGERLMFYLSVLCLHELGINNDIFTPSKRGMSLKASECLVRVAFLAGGSRDLCSLIEILMFDQLERDGMIQLRNEKSHRAAVAASSRMMLFDDPRSDSTVSMMLSLVKQVAIMVDADLSLVRSTSANVGDDGDSELPSTLNTFIPHRERGNPKSKKSARNLVQTIAELCIWKHSSIAMANPFFADAVSTLESIPLPTGNASGGEENEGLAMECIHKMQTCIRRLRQELNAAARTKGFSLCSSYLIDPSTLTLSMIRRGKEGDVEALKKLAAKKSDQRVLQLIARRYQDPSKAAPIQSVVWLQSNWVHLPKEGEKIDDEIRQLELDIQAATVSATIKRLKEKVGTKPENNVIMASLDGTCVNDASALLVATAMSSKFQKDNKDEDVTSVIKLFIGAEEYKVGTSVEEVILQLDNIFKNASASVAADGARADNSDSIPASTKDVQNFIERHMRPSDRLLIFTSADLKLEQRVLQKLLSDGCSIHCHVGDEWSARMEREGAKVGDITATLIWDNNCDLDLHAICPDGTEISYLHKSWCGDNEDVLGNLDVDMNAGPPYSSEPVENIFFGDLDKNVEAPKGNYRIFVQNYAYHDDTIRYGDPVPWKVRLTMNGESKEFEGVCTGTGTGSDVTVCEFEYSGRKAPLPEEVGSALEASSLVSVTSSTGTTLDSLMQLGAVFDQHALIGQVRELQFEDESSEVHENTSLMAAGVSFHVTNRERLYLNLSQLPIIFRNEVDMSFGGPSLSKIVSTSLAKHLVDEKIPIHELKKAGYSDEIVDAVKEQMKTFGL